eukprot:Gregarina_sp_Poly_1__2841@NODE_1793_length_3321_cov_76_000000_g1167_i0_p1_GENE_NODE_1793_length_3321_cov_76_000000_g1167_i0NODE_1793_length_3321_cov_76_000000_g1167_i0_p1_ORF_typecomplete_len352_score35_57Fbox/PF00646_33/0_008Fboxlike/PF12937_7/0_021Fboxlike/PF12937_7/6_1e03_NODE_1793_length_3321_cov_76_000000_g1167_i0751130
MMFGVPLAYSTTITNGLIRQIPRVVWLDILWRLDHTDLTNLLCTCKFFHHLLASNDFWRELLLMREAADESPLACAPSRKRYKHLTSLRLPGSCIEGPGVRPWGSEACIFNGSSILEPPRPVIQGGTEFYCVFKSVPPGRYLVAASFALPSGWNSTKTFVFAHTGDCRTPSREQSRPQAEPRNEVTFEVHSIHCTSLGFEGPYEVFLDSFKSVKAGLYFPEETQSGSDFGTIYWMELRRQEGPQRTPSLRLTQREGYYRVNAVDCLPSAEEFKIPNYGEDNCLDCAWVQVRNITFSVEFLRLPASTYSFIIEYFSDPEFLAPEFAIQVFSYQITNKRLKTGKNFAWVRSCS